MKELELTEESAKWHQKDYTNAEYDDHPWEIEAWDKSDALFQHFINKFRIYENI